MGLDPDWLSESGSVRSGWAEFDRFEARMRWGGSTRWRSVCLHFSFYFSWTLSSSNQRKSLQRSACTCLLAKYLRTQWTHFDETFRKQSVDLDLDLIKFWSFWRWSDLRWPLIFQKVEMSLTVFKNVFNWSSWMFAAIIIQFQLLQRTVAPSAPCSVVLREIITTISLWEVQQWFIYCFKAESALFSCLKISSLFYNR